MRFLRCLYVIYLDNAATGGKKPPCVVNAVNYAICELCANPGHSGHQISVKAVEAVYDVRKKLRELIGAEYENEVCFTQNCTHAINIVLQGVLKNGDHVVISSLEHNAVLRPLNYLKLNKDVEFDVAEVDLYNDEKTLGNIESLIKSNTKLIFLTAASNVIGKRLPLRSVGELCKSRNILFAVDGAQAAGVIPLDMCLLNIDYLCIAPHKGIYAPMGLGILVSRKPIDNVLIAGGTGSDSMNPYQPDELPDRIESGTVNLPGIIGCGAGIDFVRNIGIDNIHRYEMKLCANLYNKLNKIGAELYTPVPDIYSYVPLVSFNVKGYSSDEIGNLLSKEGIAVRSGLHCAPLAHGTIGTIERGTVRVSPSIYNTEEDVEKLIFIIKRLI